MRSEPGLPRKIIMLTAAAVALTLAAVFAAFAFLLERQYDDTAHGHLEQAYRHLDRVLADHVRRADALAAVVAARSDVVARLNLIARYQDRRNYDPAVFDDEKKKLAEMLEHVAAIGLAHRMLIHDALGHLVAFHVDDQNGTERSGYVTFAPSSQPEARLVEAGRHPPSGHPPAFPSLPDPGEPMHSRGLAIRNGELVAAGVSPVLRVRPDGSSERVGNILFESILDRSFVEGIAQAVGHGFALALPDGLVIASAGMETAALNLRALPQAEGDEPRFLRQGNAVIAIRPVAKTGKGLAFAAFLAARSEVSAQMTAFRESLLLAFLAIALVVLPTVFFMVRRLVSRPVATLMRGVEALKAGQTGALSDFRARDELGQLARSFNEMALAVRDREERLRKAHDNLEILVEERTRALSGEIEERRRAEQALRDSQDRLRLIFEGAADAIVSIDARGLVEAVNPAAEAMFGYRASEMLGRNVSMLMPEPHRSRHDGYLESYLKSGQAKVIGRRTEVMAQKSDGTLFPIELSVSAAQRENGPLFTGMISDITGRIEAEERIGKLSRAVEASPASVVITDTEGVIEYVNPAFSEISGYSYAEIVGQRPSALKSGRTQDAVYKDMWRTLASGQTWHGEFSNRARDGREYWVLASISPVIGMDGQATHYVAVEEDISKRKAMEEALKAARDEAESANRAKSEFLSSMSHELRTPMNAILGFSQLLLHNPKEPLSSSQTEYLGHVLTAGNHLLELINEVLDLARIEAGRLVLALEDLDIAPHLADCVLLSRTAAEKRGITLIDETQGQPLPHLRADATRFRQVLLNLLSNAVKYNRENGRVTLSAREAEGRLRLSVADTGPGIPLERQDQLFKPFNRLGAEGSNIEGTGIGLTITRKLVEQMGGQIGLESRVGEGSIFWFELPLPVEIQP